MSMLVRIAYVHLFLSKPIWVWVKNYPDSARFTIQWGGSQEDLTCQRLKTKIRSQNLAELPSGNLT